MSFVPMQLISLAVLSQSPRPHPRMQRAELARGCFLYRLPWLSVLSAIHAREGVLKVYSDPKFPLTLALFVGPKKERTKRDQSDEPFVDIIQIRSKRNRRERFNEIFD